MNSLISKLKPISQFLKPTSKNLYISLFTTSSHSHNSSSSLSRRNDEESRNVRISVWWDIENCGVPNGVNVFKIAHSITSAVRSNGIKGPLQITAFGDITCLNRVNQEALSGTGVNLVHIPNDGKNSADRSLLVDLMYWVSLNPPPAHIFLISGDRDFAGILHKLRMSNYNILLAAREANLTPCVLYGAATIMWHWNELSKGENLSGKRLNQPPDGPYNSWYGHYRGPLEDPYAAFQQQKYLGPDDSSNAEKSSEQKYRPIPMAVLRRLRSVVNSHPQGLSIKSLHYKLLNSKVPIDKDFYGYKEFSRFLRALPRIIKFEHRSDGQFVLTASTKILKAVKSNDISVNGNRDTRLSAKANSQTPAITRMVDVEPPFSPFLDEKKKTVEEKLAEETVEKKVLDASIKDLNEKNASNAHIVESPTTRNEEHNSEQKNGLFRKLWTNLFRRGIDTEKIGVDVPKHYVTSSVGSEKSFFDGEVHSSSYSASDLVAKVDTTEKYEATLGFVAKIVSWCKFWRNESSSEKPIELPGKDSSPVREDSKKVDEASHSRNHELFNTDTFWNELRSFLKTPRGSYIVLNSISREQFAERLQKEGPLFNQPLQPVDIFHLIELLVSEKKWINEFPSENQRFRLTNLSEESSTSTEPQNPTELSSIFPISSSNENPHSNVSSVVNKRRSEKSRSEIIADCKELLDELFLQMPDGFNMGLFKKLFHSKYGYDLHNEKLGHPKLVSLLQMIASVKVESCHILPANKKSTGSTSEMFYFSRKDNGFDDIASPFDELGPVEKSNPSKEEAKSSQDQNGVYESSVSDVDDEDISDVEREDCSSPEVKMLDGEDSSLSGILDSWYGNKNETNPRDHSSDPETKVGGSSSEDAYNSPGQDEDTPAVKNWRKLKSGKSYKFVDDSAEIKNDKLFDGILDSLKDSDEKRVKS